MKAKQKTEIYQPFPWQEIADSPVIGVDEVGRGCLAGRVYAAAVILNPGKNLSEYTDSKILSESKREKLAELVISDHCYGIGFASVAEVDSLNILWAAMLAMRRAVEALGVSGGHVLVDGSHRIPELTGFKQTTVVKGDLRATPIAAASIIAKVTRDHYMDELAQVYPNYGFTKNKGYGTADHRQAIAQFGPCCEHRRSFSGVKEFLGKSAPPSSHRPA